MPAPDHQVEPPSLSVGSQETPREALCPPGLGLGLPESLSYQTLSQAPKLRPQPSARPPWGPLEMETLPGWEVPAPGPAASSPALARPLLRCPGDSGGDLSLRDPSPSKLHPFPKAPSGPLSTNHFGLAMGDSLSQPSEPSQGGGKKAAFLPRSSVEGCTFTCRPCSDPESGGWWDRAEALGRGLCSTQRSAARPSPSPGCLSISGLQVPPGAPRGPRAAYVCERAAG